MDGTCFSSVRGNDATGARGRQWEFAYREALSPYLFRRVLIVIGIYLGAYTAMCPLGSNDLPWTLRLAYFGLSTALCAPLFYAEYVVTLYLTRYWTACCITVAVAAATFIATPTSIAIIYGVDRLFGTDLPAYGLPKVYLFMTLSVVLCSAVVHYLLAQRLKNESAAGPAADTVAEAASPSPQPIVAATAEAGSKPAEPPSKFFDRLPPEVGRDIIYLKMSDHYVEVVTTTGRCTILMRFADAVTELGDHGIRVHRSYWIAYPHVNSWQRHGPRTSLRLTGDPMVPVSRTYLSDVRAAVARYRGRAGATAAAPTHPDP